MTSIGSHSEAVKVLSIMHYPAYNGPINTALLIQPVIEKDNIDYYNYIAQAYFNLQDFTNSKLFYNKINEIDRLNISVYIKLGEIAMAENK